MATDLPPTQQSWAAWLLDAYSQSAMTSLDDLSDDSSYESMSPTTSDSGWTPSPSCVVHGEFFRTGKGGAGNTWSQAAIIQRTDREIQAPVSLRDQKNFGIGIGIGIENIDSLPSASHTTQLRPQSQYVRVGRALQFVQSNEPQISPVLPAPKSPPSTTSPTIHTGRGGAGNWGASAAVVKQAKLVKEQQEQASAGKRRQEAEQHVVAMLQPPSFAYTGTRRRSTLPDNFAYS